jgi:hypothetical protein
MAVAQGPGLQHQFRSSHFFFEINLVYPAPDTRSMVGPNHRLEGGIMGKEGVRKGSRSGVQPWMSELRAQTTDTIPFELSFDSS